LTGLAFVGVSFVVGAEGGAAEYTTPEQKAGYVIGANVGRNIKRQAGDVDVDALLAGMKDAMKDNKLKFSDEEAQKIMADFQTKMQAAQAAKASVAASAGKEFLEKNGKREGVTTTPSGLQYEILKKGDGAKPTAEDNVKVHYHGTLTDGSVFDSSVERGEPAEFGVGQVIKGWTEALQLMPVGSKWKLFIPAGLAYGDQSPSPKIPGGSTLVFEVELLGINK
jgi:FKBP-type peptidyl-prolyl cis-trans isomerase FklB